MKKRILFSAIIFTLLHSQGAFAQTNLDSLYTIWQTESLPDTTRADAFESYISKGFTYTNPDSAFVLADELIAFCQEKGLRDSEGRAFYSKGLARALKGNWDEALRYFTLSEEIYKELDHKAGVAGILVANSVVYSNIGEYAKALKYNKQALKIYKEIDKKSGIILTLNNIGVDYARQGNRVKALQYYMQSLAVNEEIGDKLNAARALTNIGSIYVNQEKYELGREYLEKAVRLQEQLDNKSSLPIILGNIGVTYTNEGNYAKAQEYFLKALKLFEEYENQPGITGILTMIGNNYQAQGDYVKAMENFQRALQILEQIDDRGKHANVFNAIGITSIAQNNYSKAQWACEQGLAISEEIGALAKQKDACQCLYDANKAIGNSDKALEYNELLNVIKDSLNAEETNQNLQQMEFAKEVLADSLATVEETRLVEEAHQEEVRQKNQTRNALAGGGFLVLLLAVGIYSRLRYVRKSKAIIEEEKDRSNNLLLNILPADIAEELKIHGKAEARDFDMVSILFTDFKGFTAASEKLSAQDLVAEINTCFEAFDGIMGKYNIEKIKTIGDAYMAAGGLPVPTDDSVKNTVLASLEMQAFISKRKIELDSKGLPAFEMRVGVHTGPVVAGIVGVKKFQYDIWGDTVNTASRMESSGEVGKVNVSQATYELLKEDADFTFESRGKIEAKGKGEIDMYFVSKA